MEILPGIYLSDGDYNPVLKPIWLKSRKSKIVAQLRYRGLRVNIQQPELEELFALGEDLENDLETIIPQVEELFVKFTNNRIQEVSPYCTCIPECKADEYCHHYTMNEIIEQDFTYLWLE